MNEEQKKMLTEKLLKECWHDVTDTYPLDPPGSQHCDSCEEYVISKKSHINRTFDTWPDLGAVKDALVREGLWEEFESFTLDKWHKVRSNAHTLEIHYPSYTHWLFRPVNEVGEAHFCALVAEFLDLESKKISHMYAGWPPADIPDGPYTGTPNGED